MRRLLNRDRTRQSLISLGLLVLAAWTYTCQSGQETRRRFQGHDADDTRPRRFTAPVTVLAAAGFILIHAATNPSHTEPASTPTKAVSVCVVANFLRTGFMSWGKLAAVSESCERSLHPDLRSCLGELRSSPPYDGIAATSDFERPIVAAATILLLTPLMTALAALMLADALPPVLLLRIGASAVGCALALGTLVTHAWSGGAAPLYMLECDFGTSLLCSGCIALLGLLATPERCAAASRRLQATLPLSALRADELERATHTLARGSPARPAAAAAAFAAAGSSHEHVLLRPPSCCGHHGAAPPAARSSSSPRSRSSASFCTESETSTFLDAEERANLPMNAREFVALRGTIDAQLLAVLKPG